MARLIDDILKDTLKHEGGYVDDEDDPGGPTKFGISLRFAKSIQLDVDGDDDTDAEDIKALELGSAVAIYKSKFFFKPNISKLPTRIQPSIFDMAVNMGVNRAARILQQSINSLGHSVQVDGKIGPQTIRMARNMDEKYGKAFNNMIVDNRKAFYKDLVKRNSTMKKYLAGWTRRAESYEIA